MRRFQGLCLLQEEGWRFMNSSYDRMPADARKRLSESPFNLCAACVKDRAYQYGGDYFLAIATMEAMVRKLHSDEFGTPRADR